jgi:ABC-type Fe3+-hydroxamate transport system substrate-binding protein
MRELKVLFGLVAILSTAPAFAVPIRIITLSPLLAEWTSEILGKDDTLKRLVGVSAFSKYPAYLSKISEVGAYHQISVEKVSALKPDLVIASENSTQISQLDQLKRLRVSVFVAAPENFLDMPAWILRLADQLGEHDKGVVAATRWTTSLQELKEHAKALPVQRVMVEVQDSPLIVVGGDSFLNDAFATIHFTNVFHLLAQAYPKVSKESVLAANPDQILILDLTAGSQQKAKSESADAQHSSWAKFTSLKAVQNKGVHFISADDFARCTPELLKALKQLR